MLVAYAYRGAEGALEGYPGAADGDAELDDEGVAGVQDGLDSQPGGQGPQVGYDQQVFYFLAKWPKAVPQLLFDDRDLLAVGQFGDPLVDRKPGRHVLNIGLRYSRL